MNELLGWYGYDKINAGDTQALNLSLFSSSASSAVAGGSKRKKNVRTISSASDGSVSSSSEDSASGINSICSISSPARRDGSISPLSTNGMRLSFIIFVP